VITHAQRRRLEGDQRPHLRHERIPVSNDLGISKAEATDYITRY
jgi:hypothetical protein